MPAASCYFLDWSRPLLSSAVAWLAADWNGGGPLDLSGVAVIVPTAQAGRRLREALAAYAEDRTGAVLSPLVITPEIVLTWHLPGPVPGAQPGELLLAWAAELRQLRLAENRALFPLDPVAQDMAWALQAAGDLLRLRHTLEEGARSIGDAARDLGPAHPEAARWEELARVEAAATARLTAAGLRDPLAVRLACAHAPVPPPDIRRVVLLAMPDSIHLVRLALTNLRHRGIAVDVAIHAPRRLEPHFDEWGRPDADYWSECTISIPDETERISLLPRPVDQATGVLAELRALSAGEGRLAVGTADPAVAAPLLTQAASAGLTVFDPEGRPLAEHELSWLIRCITEFVRSLTFSAAGRLLHIPDVLVTLSAATRGTQTRILRDWDAFQQQRLPGPVRPALALAKDWAQAEFERRLEHSKTPTEETRSPLPAVLQWMLDIPARLQREGAANGLGQLLETLYAGRTFPSAGERQEFLDALTAWQNALSAVSRGAAAFAPDLDPGTALELAAGLLRDTRLYPERPDHATDLHGWLELPWLEAPELVIAGLNEGMVPDSILGDPWLPDSSRAALDLRSNATRLARDSFLLTAMIQGRTEGGRVRLLAGRATATGDPLKPSRLLLRCPADDLPARAMRLFPREDPDDASLRTPPSWHRAWKLAVPAPPRDASVFHHMSVTAFSDYLACPFRFYLKHVLRMAEFDPMKSEMDARDFGGVFHDTMQELHEQTELRDSDDERAVAAFLEASASDRMHRLYGTHLSVPLTMQLDSVTRRLAAAARVHAAERKAGWRHESVEIDFPRLPNSDKPVQIEGMEIRGRIDLIERNIQTGRLRILDYKTASKPKRPSEAHIRDITRARKLPDLPDWQLLTWNGSPHRWLNLQLPLYAKIVGDHYGEPVSVGYINVPRAVTQTRLEMWDDLTPGALQSAWDCAAGVVRAIRGCQFWPPAPRVDHDDFRDLTFQDIGESFDPALLEKARMLVAGENMSLGPPKRKSR